MLFGTKALKTKAKSTAVTRGSGCSHVTLWNLSSGSMNPFSHTAISRQHSESYTNPTAVFDLIYFLKKHFYSVYCFLYIIHFHRVLLFCHVSGFAVGNIALKQKYIATTGICSPFSPDKTCCLDEVQLS